MSSIQPRKLTVVGAGYVGSTCAQLAAMKNLAREVVLIDVLGGRAQGIALDLNQMAAVEGFQARVVGTGDPEATADSDVVIASTSAPHAVIREEPMRQVVRDRGARPLFLVDLAVPRDVEPGVDDLENVFVYNIDSLQAAVTEALAGRERELPRVREICDETGREFWTWAASLDLMPTVVQLREKAEVVRQQEFERALAQMGNLTSKQQKHVHLLTKRIVQGLIGEPLSRLRTKACDGNGTAYLSILRELFDLPEGDPDALAARGQAPEGDE